MTVKELIEHAVEKVGLGYPDAVDTEVYNFSFRALNRVYTEVWNTYPWRASKEVQLSRTTTNGEVVLPSYMDNIRAVRYEETALYPLNEIILNNTYPSVWDETGHPSEFVHLAPSPVLKTLDSETNITIKSDNANDDTDVVIAGIVSGKRDKETLTLSGTSDVTSAKSFQSIENITKHTTDGGVTFYAGTSSSDTEIAAYAP